MTDILTGILYLIVFVLLIIKLPFFRKSGIRSSVLVTAFAIKIAAGFLYWYLYLYYPSWQGTSDAWRFFADSEVIYNSFWKHPLDFFQMITGIGDNHPYFRQYYDNILYWQRAYDHGLFNDNRTMIRINAILRFFSGGHYPLHILFAGFLSFAGITAIYRAFCLKLDKNRHVVLFGLFFLPSLVFWGSGISKEAISLAATGFFFYFLSSWTIKGFRLRLNFLLFLGSVVIMCFLKIYIILLLVPLIIAFSWDERYDKPSAGWKFLTILSVSAFLLYLVKFIIPDFDIAGIIAAKQKDFYATVLVQNEEAISNVPSVGYNHFSFLEAIPMAFLNSIASPFYLINVNILTICAFIENIFIILLIFYTVMFGSPKANKRSFLLLSLYFVFVYFTLIGMISPVPGAIHRYRIMAFPFFFFVIAFKAKPMFPSQERIINKMFFYA